MYPTNLSEAQHKHFLWVQYCDWQAVQYSGTMRRTRGACSSILDLPAKLADGAFGRLNAEQHRSNGSEDRGEVRVHQQRVRLICQQESNDCYSQRLTDRREHSAEKCVH